MPSVSELANLLGDLNAYVEQAMCDWQIPGTAIVVVKDGQIVIGKGYGVREAGWGARMDEHTVFQIASTTKSFTAAAVAILVDEGNLAWDDPIIQHLPDFQLHDGCATKGLMVRDILCHRTGLPPYAADALKALGYDRHEIIRRLRYVEPATSFRSRFAYQNMTFPVIGEVVAKASGQSWEAFVTERILRPLKMDGSSIGVNQLDGLENVAKVHEVVDGQFQTVPYENMDNFAAAGGINSNAIDMAKWMRIHLEKGEYAGKQVISATNLQEMHKSQIMVHENDYPLAPLYYLNGSFVTYGLGWFVYDYAGRKVVEHTGSATGVTSLVALIPAEKLGLVIFTNTHSPVFRHIIAYRLFDIALERSPRDWNSEIGYLYRRYVQQEVATQKKIEQARIRGTKPSLPLIRYTGIYHSDLYGDVRISEKAGILGLEAGPANVRGRLNHWHHDTFRVEQGDVLPPLFVTFAPDSTRRVNSMDIQRLGIFKHSLRICGDEE